MKGWLRPLNACPCTQTVSSALTELNAARAPGSTCSQVRQEYWNELVSSLQNGLALSVDLVRILGYSFLPSPPLAFPNLNSNVSAHMYQIHELIQAQIVNVLNLLACTNIQAFYVAAIYSGLCSKVFAVGCSVCVSIRVRFQSDLPVACRCPFLIYAPANRVPLFDLQVGEGFLMVCLCALLSVLRTDPRG
jgi:hypothetical protein